MKLFITAATTLASLTSFAQQQPKSYYQLTIPAQKIAPLKIEFPGVASPQLLPVPQPAKTMILPLDNMPCFLPSINEVAQMPVQRYSGINTMPNAFGTK